MQPSLELRERSRFLHGQIRQEVGPGQLETRLRVAVPHRNGIPVQVRKNMEFQIEMRVPNYALGIYGRILEML